MKNTRRPKSIGIACICISVLCLFILLVSTNMAASTSSKSYEFGGLRIACTTDSSGALKKNTLALIKCASEYENNNIIQYVATDNTQKIATAEYASDIREYIGIVILAIPAIGGFFRVFASNNLLLSALFVTCVALVCIAYSSRSGSALKIWERKRSSIQIIWVALTNSYVLGFAKGSIYQGKLKNLCVPGLSCYSCPGAYGSCPIGALQAVFTKRKYETVDGALQANSVYRFSFYVVGFIMVLGALTGRLACGFLCPFGLVQDLLYKIPVKKAKIIPRSTCARYVKYGILALFVVILPQLLNDVYPWFCKLICPSGMLFGGLPLLAANEGYAAATGVYTVIKLCILVVIIVISVFVFRPFCKYLCPLGALYGLFNRISLLKFSVNKKSCVECGQCVKACKMGVDILKNPGSAECIRCGDCAAACAQKAIHFGAYGITVKSSVPTEKNENN